MSDDYEIMQCPFCKETDFDDIGLKNHLLRGWCDAFEKVEHPKSMHADAAHGERKDHD